jgi:hypothetical protein
MGCGLQFINKCMLGGNDSMIKQPRRMQLTCMFQALWGAGIGILNQTEPN